MRCHYEVLGIERNADDKAIKNGKMKRNFTFFVRSEEFLSIFFSDGNL